MDKRYETLRFPTNLGREAIVERLVAARELARQSGLDAFAARFEDVESMPAPRIGATVVAALTWLQDHPDLEELAAALNMVAMNLKNLK